MKICLFNDIPILGGGELWVLKVYTELEALGHEVHVMCPHRSALYHHCLNEGKRLFGYSRGAGVPFYGPVYHYLRKYEIDMLYCTLIGQFDEAGVLGEMVARINAERPGERRLGLVLKTGLPPMGGLQARRYGFGARSRVQGLHVVSEVLRQNFTEWGGGLSTYVRTLREGVDLSRFAHTDIVREEAKAHWGIPAQRRVLTCLARLSAAKGQDNLLLALPAIVSEWPDLVLMLAGVGEDEQRLRELCEQLGLGDYVRFLGHVEEVPFLLAATDVLCHPSLTDGMPNSLVEAMAMEVPVVTSSVGGIPELVEDERSGLLVGPHDINALSAAVLRLLDDALLAGKLARAGRRRVLADYDLRTNTRLLADDLAEALRELRSLPAATLAADAPPVPVLFLMNTLRTGGEETEVALLVEHLDRNRFRPLVLSLFANDEQSAAADRIRTLGTDIDEGCHDLSDWNEKAAYVLDFLRREGIRIVVACQDAAFAHQLFAYVPRDECRLIEHGGIVAEALNTPKTHTYRYVGVSPAIREAAAATMSHPGRALCLPSMVDTNRFPRGRRAELRLAYGIAPAEVVATFVGRLDPKKGVDRIIRVAPSLLDRHGNFRVLVVGGHDAFQPAYAEQLHQLAASLGLPPERFIFTGPRADVPSLLVASDILILPATGEGMSHVINEAGAAGLAVVATHDGAAAEQLAEGRAGKLLDTPQDAELERILDRLIEDAPLRHRLGTALRERVELYYSVGTVLPRWEALLAGAARELAPRHTLHLRHMDATADFPVEIQIQTNTLCNATCVMCPYPEVSQEFPVGKMDEALYRKILDECAGEPGLRRLEPFLMNEAFIDKRVPEWIALAKQRVPHAAVTVTTNGTPLVPAVTDRLIESGIDAIWFSFNGATPETYEKIMGIPYTKVMANIRYLLHRKPDHLQVYVNMIETDLMAPEIEQNIRQWRELGVQAGASPLVNRGGNVKNFAELNYRPMSERPVRTCELPYYKMYILHNGDAIMCCMDWRRSVVLGNVGHQSIREIWNGEAYRSLRRRHTELRDGEIPLCAGCSYTLN